MGYMYMGPQKPGPLAKSVSGPDLVRLEKSNPAALTDVQRQILASYTPEQKQQMLTAPSFSTASALPRRAAVNNTGKTASN